MQTNEQTSNILNSVKWQVLRDTRDNANHLLHHFINFYSAGTAWGNTQASCDIYNSMNNLYKNNITIGQLCEWVELNKGKRIKNKKDYQYIVNTIVNIA